MKHFKVCINYGRKCAAYETIVTAATEADAKHQAKVLASMCGFIVTGKHVAHVLNVTIDAINCFPWISANLEDLKNNCAIDRLSGLF